MLLGMFTFASLTINRARAKIWPGGPGVHTADLARAISERHLACQPEVEQAEVLLQQRGLWMRPDGSPEVCLVVGVRLEEGSRGAVQELTPDLRVRLAEHGAIVVDES